MCVSKRRQSICLLLLFFFLDFFSNLFVVQGSFFCVLCVCCCFIVVLGIDVALLGVQYSQRSEIGGSAMKKWRENGWFLWRISEQRGCCAGGRRGFTAVSLSLCEVGGRGV